MVDEVGLIVKGEKDLRTGSIRFPFFNENGWNVQPECFTKLKEGTIPELMKKYTTVIHHEIGHIYASDPPQIISRDEFEKLVEKIEEENKIWKEVASSNPKIIHAYPKRGLYIVGEFKHLYVQRIAETFRKYWPNVICVDVDKLTRKPVIEMDPIKYPVLTTFSFPFLVIQTERPISFKYLPNVTVFYYAHEAVFPYLPYHCKITGLFHGYLSAPEQYKRCHPKEMMDVKFTKLIPYGWDPKDFPYKPFDNRPNIGGFMGTIPNTYDPYDVERADYLSVHIRDLRLKYLPIIKEWMVEDRKPFNEYVTFLQTTKVVVNITAIMGFMTERQFHAMGCGAVLLQNYFRGMDDLGFKDFENCLCFKDEDELREKMKWIKNNPDKLKQIAENGYKLALKHTYDNNVQEMIKSILAVE